MSNKMILRKVDAVGRISLPPKLLDQLHLEVGSSVLLYMDGEKVILKKDEKTCVFCGSEDVVVDPTEIEICTTCRQDQGKRTTIIDKRYEKQMIPNGRRIVIPFKIRHQLKIGEGDKLEVWSYDDHLEIINLMDIYKK
ncbi:hypothetical protein CVD28_01275 [Bacillus sp. M6-12]|uniref:AbrB/MazE/SpoVT family DNA-binding domain-containing protein n=1 Tax=Bacillus sp. M6-12 TaxID=2054166 RepID=UPI000C77CA68|nr:AbrB/MazE/SpoVT family DNA-binding domain-containing protein [Bacillus sp. M6-12]PLS19065.1 hypothetical protein CVD28_01275 [Bacillus sp. M6-12]